MIANYSAMAGLACGKDIPFMGILQPHALENYKNLTESEKDKIQVWEQKYGKFTGGVNSYKEKMAGLYDAYEAELNKLNTKFSHCPNVRFASYRDLFSFKHQADFYVDNVHYTEEGNQRIASQMVLILKQLFSN